MRNLRKSQVSIDDAYQRAMSGLHDPKRQFMTDQEQLLKQSFADYDHKAVSGDLKSLQSLWSDADENTYTFSKKNVQVSETHKHIDLAYDLYGSNKPIINKLWEELELLNSTVPGERQELICPVCGLRKCNQMDHHAPRALNMFPEYSVHLSNLIPLCDDCNEPKRSYWVEEKDGVKNRIWFNAYYDKLPQFDIFESSIIIVGGMPSIKVELNPILDRQVEVHDVIYRTATRLGLSKRYQDRLNSMLSSFINDKLTYFECEKVRYKDATDYWNSIKNTISILLSKSKSHQIVEMLFYKAILKSVDFEIWMLKELNKI